MARQFGPESRGQQTEQDTERTLRNRALTGERQRGTQTERDLDRAKRGAAPPMLPSHPLRVTPPPSKPSRPPMRSVSPRSMRKA